MFYKYFHTVTCSYNFQNLFTQLIVMENIYHWDFVFDGMFPKTHVHLVERPLKTFGKGRGHS